ncbi:PIK-related kinase, FATC [Kalmanozyma brasiliensis GHG001]|uniref:Serine/threonine-protein kinase TEL1 n=1 Tax=Kalmanozyma brasiliensis (strain GHG001) TaxID=1365824 RepID=V5GT30_KALBG|nr:PIK-related kinase, FATC [Kalmanozyma brasiliensis GHG001]EST09037.1 PIK-related kinase, FATC [Kalmanozyma brasiliensis GHG001]
MVLSLKEVLEQVRSDKIKDRQQGIEALEHIFADSEHVLRIDSEQDGKPWLKIFQAVFACVLADKAACIKKGSLADAQPIALSRLQRSAQLLRSLVDKAAPLLTRKVVKALVTHIVQMVNHRGSLLRPIASAYMSALCAILKQQHHVDHLDPDDWQHITSLCFDVLLGRELDAPPSTPDPTEWLASVATASDSAGQRRGLSLEDAVTAECLRHLMASTVAPLLGPEGLGLSLLADYTRFFIVFPVESSAHLPAMSGFVTVLEHIELNHTKQVADAALALRQVILALWKTKSHLLKVQLLLFLRISIPIIASCASGQSEVASPQSSVHKSAFAAEAFAFLELVHEAFLRDPDTRWALEPIRMDELVFCWPQQDRSGQSRPVSPFSNPAFYLAPHSNGQGSIAWCRISLQVDIIDALTTLESAHQSNRSPTPTPSGREGTNEPQQSMGISHRPALRVRSSNGKRGSDSLPSSPQKRRRTDLATDADSHQQGAWLRQLVEMISPTASTPNFGASAKLGALQLLTFLLLIRPDLIESATLVEARQGLLALATDTDSLLVSWSLVGLGAIVLALTSAGVKDSGVGILSADSSLHAWGIAVRKLQFPDTCRASAFLLNIMLATAVLSEDTLQPEVSRLVAEVDLQGPPVLCDSVCHLMTMLVQRTTSSRVYQHLDSRRKVGAWFASSFSPDDALQASSLSASSRPSALLLSYQDLYRLVNHIIADGASDCVEAPHTTMLGDDVADLLRRRWRLQPLRDLTLRSCTSSTSTAEKGDHSNTDPIRPSLLLIEPANRMLIALDRKLDACLGMLHSADAEVGAVPAVPYYAAIAVIHAALLTIDVGAQATSQSSSQRTARVKRCCQLILQIVDLTSAGGMSARERSLVLQQLGFLDPLDGSATYDDDDDTRPAALLTSPSKASGIAAVPASREEVSKPTPLSRTSDRVKQAWTVIREADMLEVMLSRCEELLEDILCGDEGSDPKSATIAESSSRDAFDDMQESSASSNLRTKATTLGSDISTEARDTIVGILVHVLAGVPRMLTESADSKRDEVVVALFFDCPVESMIPLAPVLFDLLHRDTLWMSQRDLVDALDRLGTDLLTPYRYARVPAARIAAVRAITAVVPLLLESFDEQSDLFDKVQKLGAFFADQIGRTKWPTPWQIQLACADFLAVCLKMDPDGCLRRSGSARASAFAPAPSLLAITTDADVRVRALGSPVAACVFEASSSDEEQMSQLYTSFRDGLPSDPTIPQHILTRALSLANVAIANSAVRRSALFHLLEIVLATNMLHATVQHLFAQVANRLGFPDSSSCYQAFAGQITWGMATNNYDPLQVPWKVLGFASKRDCLEATFTASGSMLLAAQTKEGRTQFDALVQLTKRTQQQGLQECLPFLTAAYLGFAVHAAQQQGSLDPTVVSQQTLHELSLLGFAESDTHSVLRDMIMTVDDLVVVSLLGLYFEPASTLTESRRAAVEALTQHNVKNGKILASLTPIPESCDLVLHEPSRPFFASAVVCAALSVLPCLGIEPFRKEVVYNVLRHTLHQIASSRFHNDQLRMCAALRIYIAMCGDSFWADDLNARTLIKSIELLLGQGHLRDEFRPISMYACLHSTLAKHAPEVLVSCVVTWSAEVAEKLAEAPASGDWLLESARAIAKTSPIATSATVLLWPVKLSSTEHSAIESLIDLDTVAFAMEACPRVCLHLASLQRIRSVLRKADKVKLEAFCHGSARKLLERMTESHAAGAARTGNDSWSDVVSDIFARIASAGELTQLQPNQPRLRQDGKDYGRSTEAFLATVDTGQTTGLSAAVVLTIHDLASALPLESSYQAFETLRGIATVVAVPLTSLHAAKVPSAIREELDRIRPSIASSHLSVVAAPPALLDPSLMHDRVSSDRWICRISAHLCEMICSFDQRSILRPVRHFVATNSAAAKSLFHILLLWLTVTDLEPAAGVSSSNTRKGSKARRSDIQEQARSLESCRKAVATHFEQVLQTNASDPACSATIVQALLALRSFRPVPAEPDKVCFWYPVDTCLLAKRCIACGLYSAAIFFVEHGVWEEEQSQASSTSQTRTRTELLHQAYMNIDDPDAFYGIKDGDVRELLLKRLHHEGQWLRAFQYHGADYEASASDGQTPSGRQASALGQSLSLLGFRHLVEGVSPASETREEPSQPTADRLGSGITTWDLPTNSSSALVGGNSVELVLKTLRQASVEQNVDGVLSQAVQSQLKSFCSIPAESIAAKRRLRGELLALGQIKDWRKASGALGPEEAVAHLRSIWTQADDGNRFEVTEKVLNTRQAVLEAARQRMQSHQIGDVLDGPAEQVARAERLLLVQLSRHSREHEKLQKAINATARAERIESALGDGANLAREEFAAVLWDQKEHPPAIQLLSQIVDHLAVTTQASAQQRRRGARLLALLAQWRATARSQHPREIDRSLFEPALKLIATLGASGAVQDPAVSAEASEIAYRWARFAEEHHRSSDAAEIVRLRRYIQSRVGEIAQNQRECERTTSKTEKSKLLQFQRQAEKMLRQDETRLSELEASRTHFLRRSVVMYARALSSTDAHDDAVARLVSLWFENADDIEVNRLLTGCLSSIPSRKFVPLMHQLSARLTEVPDQSDTMAPFQRNLTELLLRMCQDHPFHCLYAVFALIKTGADAKAASNRHGSGSSLIPPENSPHSQSPPILRSAAAEKIWNQIKRRPSLSKRIKTFEELCLAYVEWAEFDLASRADRYFQNSGAIKKGALRMPPSGELRLARLRNLDVPVATARLDIDPTCRYENFVSIVRYSETFTTAGGIHLPKISECIGSDGKRYKQLFKRDDDLRQDAVMQQVFRMVNELLQADRRTRERKLSIRTYTVLPLGPQCGLLEFVVNTVPLGEVLIALHARYRPHDITPMQARSKIREAQPTPAEAKLEAFLDVCEQMRPAFRYFFSDAQRMPRDWYETRLRYTRSVSTNSIVGHVLGLGDRHVSNILLDTESGELVHIDFGVAFDQGKLLPIPELVPFRLTRDIVDGMGIHGVEGTFRRCCEETLRVLRAHQDVIKTVLEVFRHDPLFAWTSNPIKVLRAQEDEESSLPAMSLERSGTTAGTSRSTPAPAPTAAARARVSRSTTPFAMPGEGAGVVGTDTAELSADRAVTSVMSKLSSSLSIEYTVNDLIQQAMDAGNLSAIFHGWQAAL